MKDLLKLYSFESVHDTDDEQRIFEWICKWLKEHNIPFKTLGKNIYHLSKDNFIILSAHLDQVKTNGAAKYFRKKDGIIKAYNYKWERTSLGADDKNGVWLILKILESGQDVNFIISEGEERGCIGIRALEDNGVLDDIDSSQICLVLDRRGNTDILKGGGSDIYCSTLAQSLCNFLQKDYKVTTGSLSDTAHISMYCESVNISTAYDSPHTSNETTNFNRLQELLEDLNNIIMNFIHYPTEPDVYLSKTYYYNNGNSKTTKTYDNYYGGNYGKDEWYNW